MTWFWSLPRLSLEFATLKDVRRPAVVLAIIEAIAAMGLAWTPEKYSLTLRGGRGRDRRFGAAAIAELERAVRNEDLIVLDIARYRFRAAEKAFRFEAGFGFSHPFPSGFGLSAVRSYFEERPAERLAALLALARMAYLLLQPELGSVHDADDQSIFFPGPDPKSREVRISAIFWITFLGPRFVERFGRDRVLSAPAYRVEALPDGGAMLLVSESPFDPTIPENRARQLAAMAHLGIVEEAQALYKRRLEHSLETGAWMAREGVKKRHVVQRVKDVRTVPWLRDLQFTCPPEVEIEWVPATAAASRTIS